MATKICFFNHKGGVGKTTNAYHLGWSLAEKGKTVLFVDLDSQCNLTQIALGLEDFEQHYENQPKQNIKDLLTPAFESRPVLLQPAECIKVKSNEKLWLIPGSFEITEYEVQLGISFQLYNSFSTMKHLPGSFHYLIEKTAEKYSADYVIIDLNPNLSAINQNLVTGSDYFIIPAMPDYYSLMAIRSLSKIIPQWEYWAKQAREVFKKETYPFPQSIPQFLGYIINDFSTTKDKETKEKKATSQYAVIMKKIEEELNNTLVPSLSSVSLYNQTNSIEKTTKLAEIANFGNLGALHQQDGLPVFKLDLDKRRPGSPTRFSAPNVKKKQQDFQQIYSDLVDKILNLTTQHNEHSDTTISAEHSSH